MSLKNKVAIVTGAGSGIGAAIAKVFAEEGAKVALLGFELDKLKKVGEACEKYGYKPLIIEGNVTIEKDGIYFVKETIKTFGRLDILVNNAGIGRPGSILSNGVLKAFDEVMNTNIRAIVHMTHLSAPYLIENKGNVINISSVLGQIAPPQTQLMPYCISKASVNHFTKCAAAELAPKGVRVNSINPGPVYSDIFKNSGYNEEAVTRMYKHLETTTALKRVSTAEEIADLALFLASDKARGITGSSYVIDNGETL